MALQRSVGLIGLTFVAVSGMIGSGWLFAPMKVAAVAGPSALVSWLIGGFAVLLLALAFAEICSMLPVAGGIARVPHFSHGNVVSAVVGWTAWCGYVTTAPIEAAVMLQYLSNDFPELYGGAEGQETLTGVGMMVAIGVMALLVVINAVGVKAMAATNTAITWVKIIMPLVIAGLFIADSFHVANFTEVEGGFAPGGLRGILSGVATGGVIFAFIGFRHAIDLAGEARNPQVTVPLSLILGVAITLVVYLAIQIAFIGAVPTADLSDGWEKLSLGHSFGPFATLATGLGMMWLVATIYGGSVIGPFGGALVAVGSNARLAMALSQNGFFPRVFQRLSKTGVPLPALLLNFAVGTTVMLLVPFSQMVELNEASLTLSFCVGPICLIAMRAQMPDRERGFRLPAAGLIAASGFIITSLIVYWTGWETNLRLFLAVAVGLVLLIGLKRLGLADTHHRQDWREAGWLPPYLIGLALISWLGTFGGGIGILPFGWDMVVIAGFSLVVFILAFKLRLPIDQVAEYLREEALIEEEEYGPGQHPNV